MTRFRGTYSVMVTAYDDAGTFDAARMARFTDWQVREGIHGLIPLGSTGEFLSLSPAEREAVARCVVDTVAGRVPVLLGAGAESTEAVIENCRMAEAVGADGVMIIPPFYSTPTEEELYRHYARISEATVLPIMLYNNPATANVDLTPPVVARLSTLRGVDYIKESTMDVTRVRDILDLCGDRMTVFGGIMGFESFVNGAEGWVAVGSNILPRGCARLFSLTADAQDYDAARALYARILPVIRLVGGHRYVSATKAALEIMGLPTGAPRSPRLPLPEAEMPELRQALAAVGLLEGAEA
ncbi:dihydrodipicolinate synthase family protein [Roseivivax sp.]